MQEITSTPVVELVVYKIKSEVSSIYVESIIDEFRELVASFEGFISYDVYRCSRDENVFMDFVKWETLELAEEAARKVKVYQQESKFSEYLASFESVEIFNHFDLLKS